MANGQTRILPKHPSVSKGHPSLTSGILFDFKRFSLHDGPGIRTTVFLKGCPLHCAWCHNPESISPEVELHHWPERCIFCGECVEHCPENALSLSDHMLHKETARCLRCGACATACPAEAWQQIGRVMTLPEVMAEIQKDLSFYDESGGGVTFSGGEPLLQPEFLAEALRACKAIGLHTTVDTTVIPPGKTWHKSHRMSICFFTTLN